jgi:hypothetical protein
VRRGHAGEEEAGAPPRFVSPGLRGIRSRERGRWSVSYTSSIG